MTGCNTCDMILELWPDNTAIIQITGLKDLASDMYVNTATATVRLQTPKGVDVTGVTWPITLAYVPDSNGTYRGVIPAAADLVAGRQYKYKVEAVAGASIATWAGWLTTRNRPLSGVRQATAAAETGLPSADTLTLDEIQGVDLTGLTTNMVLTYNGTQWVGALPAVGSTVAELDDLSDVDVTTLPKEWGQQLVWDGFGWVNMILGADSVPHTPTVPTDFTTAGPAGVSFFVDELGARTTDLETSVGAIVIPPDALVIACSDEGTALTTGTAKVTFRMPYAMTLSRVRASLTTAQASGNILTVDINKNGTSILSTKLTVDNTEKTSTTAVAAAVISDTALTDDAEITIDIDQIGDGTAKGLKISLYGARG